jgi:hypothetical protein
MIAAKTFDPSHLSQLMSQESDTGDSNEAKSIFSDWIQQTTTQAQSYQAIGDQLIDLLLKDDSSNDTEESRDLISKTVGDLLTRAYLHEDDLNTSGNGNRRSDQKTDLSDHYERFVNVPLNLIPSFLL